jgi:hypothetical protein
VQTREIHMSRPEGRSWPRRARAKGRGGERRGANVRLLFFVAPQMSFVCQSKGMKMSKTGQITSTLQSY